MSNHCDCAVKMSLLSDHNRYKHGAILVKGNEVVGRGYNDFTHHAETKAILSCLQRVLQDYK